MIGIIGFGRFGKLTARYLAEEFEVAVYHKTDKSAEINRTGAHTANIAVPEFVAPIPTAAPTTVAPTTVAPTTVAPTTVAPTTTSPPVTTTESPGFGALLALIGLGGVAYLVLRRRS